MSTTDQARLAVVSGKDRRTGDHLAYCFIGGSFNPLRVSNYIPSDAEQVVTVTPTANGWCVIERENPL